MNELQESDWKYMKSMKKILLDRLCNRILDTIQKECNAGKREPDVHQQYLKVFSLIQKFDKTVGECFDDWRRFATFKIPSLYHERRRYQLSFKKG